MNVRVFYVRVFYVGSHDNVILTTRFYNNSLIQYLEFSDTKTRKCFCPGGNISQKYDWWQQGSAGYVTCYYYGNITPAAVMK